VGNVGHEDISFLEKKQVCENAGNPSIAILERMNLKKLYQEVADYEEGVSPLTL
jgi:hypothetical protein